MRRKRTKTTTTNGIPKLDKEALARTILRTLTDGLKTTDEIVRMVQGMDDVATSEDIMSMVDRLVAANLVHKTDKLPMWGPMYKRA